MLKLNNNSCLTNIQTFNDKMLISTSKEDKKITLWDENTLSVLFTYEDSNMKSFISENKLVTVGSELFSEYIISLQENKSLISIWKTNSSECAIKCSPIDERITSLEISQNNSLIFIGSETGVVYIYEIFSGNLISNVMVCTSAILSIKSIFNDGSIIAVLTSDYFRLFSLDSLVTRNNNVQTTPMIEEPNYDDCTNFLYIPQQNLFCLYSQSKNKLVLAIFPEMKNVKVIYLHSANCNNINFTKIYSDLMNLYVIFENGTMYRIDISEVLKESQTTLNYSLLEHIHPIIQVDSPINCLCITKKNLVLGMEDGKIKIYNKQSLIMENTFSNHKGCITNILLINRPISQYGLNFNSKIEELNLKAFKKPSIVYNPHVSYKKSIKTQSYVDNYLDKVLSNTTSNPDRVFFSSEDRLPKKEEINSTHKAQNLNQVTDVAFLKKKLNEAYSVLNKK